jgi:hypothetical protein
VSALSLKQLFEFSQLGRFQLGQIRYVRGLIFKAISRFFLLIKFHKFSFRRPLRYDEYSFLKTDINFAKNFVCGGLKT